MQKEIITYGARYLPHIHKYKPIVKGLLVNEEATTYNRALKRALKEALKLKLKDIKNNILSDVRKEK